MKRARQLPRLRNPRLVSIMGAALLALAVTTPAYRLDVVSEDGQVLWRLPVHLGSQVGLAYTNSLYHAPTEDRFLVTAGGFELTEVRSTSDAVLESNGIPGPYHRDGPFIVAKIHRTIPIIVTRIGPVGQQRLFVDRREIPIYEAGVAQALTISVRRGSWLLRTIAATRAR